VSCCAAQRAGHHRINPDAHGLAGVTHRRCAPMARRAAPLHT